MPNIHPALRHLLPAVLACTFAFAAVPAAASGLLEDYRRVTAKGNIAWRLDLDNDSLLLNRDDGFYTSGVQLARAHALREGDRITVFGWRLGQQFYTASDIKLPPARVAAPDHPYAAWLYGGLFREEYRADGSHVKYGIDFGCLGPCAGGKWLQTNLHRLLDQPLPQGWSRQVRNEAGVVLHGELAPLRWQLAPWLDATPVLHARFGNIHTDAGAGVTVRAGRLPDFATGAGLHGYLRLDARVIGHDASLEGGYFSSDNPHVVKPRRTAGEAELGLAWSDGRYGLSGAVVRRSSEIATLSQAHGGQTFVRLRFDAKM